MQEITEIAELKEIQLGILREIDKLCKAYHLKYFMSDGTLLGAVRHKGYSGVCQLGNRQQRFCNRLIQKQQGGFLLFLFALKEKLHLY